MPTAPRPYCSMRYIPCPNKAGMRSGRCDEHEREYQRKVDRKRGTGAQRGSTPQWHAFANVYLQQHPRCMCAVCVDLPYWQREVATDIDHIDGTGRNGPRAYDPSNLRPMSHAHHSQRTARDQPGGWHKTIRDRKSN